MVWTRGYLWHKECHNGLGIMWHDGLIDGRKDSKAAFTHFAVAAGQGLTPSGSERGDLKLAISYFEVAMRHGLPFEIFYGFVKIQAAQIEIVLASLKQGTCSIATAFFKVISERGFWGEDLIQEGEEAWETGTRSGKHCSRPC